MNRFPLRGITHMRLICRQKDCDAVTELPLTRVLPVMKQTGACCPVCGRPFFASDQGRLLDPVDGLAQAIADLDVLRARIGVEIVHAS